MINLRSTMRLAQSILRRKSPPVQKKAPQKEPLKNIRPGAHFWNFTVLIAFQEMSYIKYEPRAPIFCLC